MDCAGIKIAGRRVASTKQFVKDTTLSRWERAGPEVATVLRSQGSFLFMEVGVLGHGPDSTGQAPPRHQEGSTHGSRGDLLTRQCLY